MSYVKSQVVVMFRPGTDMQAVTASLGLELIDSISSSDGKMLAALIKVPEGTEAEWLARFRERDDVRVADYDILYQLPM